MEYREIRERLAGLDCTECGHESCDDLAKTIVEGKARLEDCVVLSAGKKVAMKVGGREIPMGPFVQDFVKNTVLGMAKSLKKVDMKEGDVVEIRIVVSQDDL